MRRFPSAGMFSTLNFSVIQSMTMPNSEDVLSFHAPHLIVSPSKANETDAFW